MSYYYDLQITNQFDAVTNHYGQYFPNPVSTGDRITNPYNSSELCAVETIVHNVSGTKSVIFAKVNGQ